MLDIAVLREDPWPAGGWDGLARRAVAAAIARTPYGELLTTAAMIEVSIRLAADGEVQALNRHYRHKDMPTNVLSFPMVQPDLIATITQDGETQSSGAGALAGEVLLGDIVLAHGVCVAEAAERGIDTETHATHLIVHGTLHLLGYDHLIDDEGDSMEAIEREALADLGIADPYHLRED